MPKPTEVVAVKIRVKESLRRNLAAEGKRAGRSLNQEMVRRLEQSFVQQHTETIIRNAALSAGIETSHILTAQFNTILELLGRPDLTINFEQGEQGNG